MHMICTVGKYDKSCVEICGPSSLFPRFVSINDAIFFHVKRCGKLCLFCLLEKCVLSKRDHHSVVCDSSP